MSSFDVRVFAIRRRPGRTAFEVRWRVAGCDRSRSFMTRALADSYRAELVRAARKGPEFDPATGEPAAWAVPEPAVTTWCQHAVAYAQMKWPHLAPHSRASLADALATVTPRSPGQPAGRPSARMLRAALYGHAFNRPAALPDPDPVVAQGARAGWRGPHYRSASSATRRSSGPRWTRYARAWMAAVPQRTRSPASGRCSTTPSATPSSSGCSLLTRSAGCGGMHPEPPWPSTRRPSPAPRRCGQSWARWLGSARN